MQKKYKHPLLSRSLARYIASQTFFLMFAGTDTTTQALLTMAILCHRHPQWFRKLQQEQDRLRAEFGDTLDRKACLPAAPPPPSVTAAVLIHMRCAITNRPYTTRRGAGSVSLGARLVSSVPYSSFSMAMILRTSVIMVIRWSHIHPAGEARPPCLCCKGALCLMACTIGRRSWFVLPHIRAAIQNSRLGIRNCSV